MFGKNQIASKDKGDGSILKVNSIFPTIQGEGPLSGQAAIFVRLAGCNLACYFCDTEFEKFEEMSLDQIMLNIEAFREVHNGNLIVLTGGEPMLQQVIPLIHRLVVNGFRVQIETAGTVWPEPAFVKHHNRVFDMDELAADEFALTFVCSPKTPKVHPKIVEYCRHYKYIVRAADNSAFDGLPVDSTQKIGIKSPVYRPGDEDLVTVWVQPCEEYKEVPNDMEARITTGVEKKMAADHMRTKLNTDYAAKLCMLRNYRLSIQIHKIIGLP